MIHTTIITAEQHNLRLDDGLKLLHAENKSEERDSAPAENLMTELLEMPVNMDWAS